MRMLEERLGRNASDQQARTAERFLFLDDGGLEAELRRADRGNVAAGAGADHDHVVIVRHVACDRNLPPESGALSSSLQR